MSTHKSTVTPKIIALLFFAFIAYIELTWINTITHSPATSSHLDDVERFQNSFPPFLRSLSRLTLTTLIASVIAVIFSNIWFKRAKGIERAIAIIILIISVLVIVLTLFQSM